MTTEQLQEAYAVVFFTAVIVFALLEVLAPRREAVASLRARWVGNIGVTVIGTVLLHVAMPVGGIAVAHLMQERNWGLLNQLALPQPLAIIAALILLDLFRYLIHRCMHANPLLWRIHRLHHTDQDMDFTTELRVHPLEMLLGSVLGLAIIALIGPPPVSMILFAIIFAVQAFWTHSNVRFPAAVDRVVRLVFTTPEVHRIHHSVDLRESNSNLGAMFTFWDRIFGTFVEQPALGHEQMVLGVAEFRDHKHMSLPWMLVDPFLNGEDASATSERPLPADAPAVR